MIYNRSIEGSGSLPQHESEVTTMLKDMDFGVYGKGIDGYIHYSLAMDRIREEEENRKALMDEFDNDVDEMDEFVFTRMTISMDEVLLQGLETPARYPQNGKVHTRHMLWVC